MSFKIDLKIFFFLIVFYFTKQISIYSYMMIFAIIHEFAHCFAGLIVGMKPENIILKITDTEKDNYINNCVIK